jgi:FMN phosphatase YigB (HAD superfamily)
MKAILFDLYGTLVEPIKKQLSKLSESYLKYHLS